MDHPGIIKQMSLSGSVLIPRELREALDWQGGTYLKLTLADDGLLLTAVPEKDGLLRDVMKALRGLDEEALRTLLTSAWAHKKQRRSG